MNFIKQNLRQWRWYQWLLVALTLLYALYIALSYLWLPGKLQDVVQTDVAQLIGRDIRVERIAFDPFALALTVEQFSVADGERPLLAWQRLLVNFEAWGSLFGWQIKLGSLHLDAPQIAIRQRREDFNFSDILARFPAAETPVEEEKTALALRINDIRISNGLVRFDDSSGKKPAHSSVDDINIVVQSLYLATGDDQLHPYELHATLPGGGSLSLSGEYRLEPLLLHSEFAAEGIVLARLADFVENQVPMYVRGGRLSLQAHLQLEQQPEGLQLRVQRGGVLVEDLVLDDALAEPPLLRGKQMQLSGIELDLLQQRVAIAMLDLDGISSHQWLDASGQTRLTALLPADTESAAPTPAAPASPWDISLDRFSLRDSQLSVNDQSNGVNATQTLSDIQLKLSDIRLQDGTQIPLALSAQLNGTGQLSVEGMVTPTPLTLALQYQLDGLALPHFNPYVEASTWLQLQQGTLNASGDVQMGSGEPLPLTVAMNATIQNLQGNDSRTGKSVVKWQTLALEQLQLDLAQQTISINRLLLDQPDVAVLIGADKQLNLATLTRTAPADAVPDKNVADNEVVGDEEAAATPPWHFSVADTRVTQGVAQLHDASIKPAFSSGLYGLQFQLGQLASNGTTAIPFSMQASIDRYAPFSAKGTLAPLSQQPGFAFSSQLKGLEMPALSPYTGTYIGHNLRSGKLTLELDYELKAQRLKGKNSIVAKDLYLGDIVQSDQAVDAPVALGLALLRDTSGLIDLDVGVNGDLNEPGFSVSGVVLKALMNVLVKAATSPFSLLGSLVGGREDLGDVEFASGSAEIDADNQQKLQQLAQALAQRPQLDVTIKGNASADETVALQLQRVRQQVAAQRKIALAQLDADTWLTDAENRDALEELSDELDLPDAGDREDALEKSRPEWEADALAQQVYQDMLQDVMARQAVSEQDLLSLADRRALAIKQYLVETTSLDHSRIDMAKAGARDLQSRICSLALKPR